ncbi:hypothetical protein O3M35_008512 [Rhynocoris fuscipes]|uniref:Uncharacterized protein n=1 Tax=Rhynocoris fuscipes TaxID=488301 RepID=A0AAW1DBT3_9HEMI
MELFAFSTTSRQADYIKILKQSDRQCCHRTAQSCKFCIHHTSKTVLASYNFFLYTLLMLLNLALISFWVPSASQGCYFT